MVLILLTAVGFLACAFFLKTPATSDEADETSGGKRPEADPSASTEKQDRFCSRPRQMHHEKARSRGCGLGCNECERAAYEKVARSLRSGKRV